MWALQHYFLWRRSTSYEKKSGASKT